MSDLPSVNLVASKLPSQGKCYPDNFEATYRSYSFGEIKYASTSDLNEKQSLELVLKGVKTSMPKGDFTLSDVLFIGLLRKISSLGTAKVQVPYTHPQTKKTEYHIFSLDDIEFYDMEAPKLPVSVELSDGKTYSFMPLTVKSYLNLVKRGKANDVVALYAAMCINHDFNDSYNFFNNTTDREDGEILEEIDSLLSHGIKPLNVKYTVNINGKEVEKTLKLRVEGRQALLLPFREKGKSVRDRICFGTTSEH